MNAEIKAEKNSFDDAFLDVVGNEFKFDHAKGLAEWMKNSADAYSTTAQVKDAEQFILLRFKQGNPKKESVFECIDFVGMTRVNIDKAVKIWGLPTAAKRGTDIKTFGGHGNGGKFYMRQMFGKSRFITYRDGKLNVFGFDEKRRYGYAQGLVDKAMTIDEAMAFAGIEKLDVPDVVRKRWKRSPKNVGFTVVRGERPDRFSGRATIESILERLRFHPQARRVLAHKQVYVLSHAQHWGKRLTTPTITPRVGFEEPRVIPLPRKFDFKGETFEFRNKEYPEGKLTLYTAEQPLARSGELAALNSVDILGEIGCIGSYRMHELGYMRFGPETEFIYGECECPLMEDKKLDCVKNDREKLVPNERTDALLEWIRQHVDKLAEEMADKTRDEKKSRDLRQSAQFNHLLDRWKNKFMTKLSAEIFGGAGIGGSFGGTGGGGGVGGGTGEGKGGRGDEASPKEEKGRDGDDEGQGGGSGDIKKKGPRFPRVLLSGHDMDPLDPNPTNPFLCDERHPPVYQRAEDIEHGIYWINTARPLANKIMDAYGADSARWREYLFQRYTDIILKQSIYEMGSRDPEMTPDKVDGLIDDVTSKVHDAASEDLESFLFDESLTGSAASGPPPLDADGGAYDEGDIEGIPSLGELLSDEAKKIKKAKDR
ncbi:hypothetical protein [Stigmatella erecta]|uniref:hypothetical protein n=1 Tax=Stigmatella erecta TaxID=83460 RepID=UPI0015A5E77F|nr:hypothetical protein [Stigmatella erecta]